RQRAAWRHLVDLFGGQSAAWVTRNTKPADWDSLSVAGKTQSLIAFLHGADADFFTALLALPLTPQVRAALAKAVAEQDGDVFIQMAEEQSWGERVNAAARSRISGFPAADLTK